MDMQSISTTLWSIMSGHFNYYGHIPMTFVDFITYITVYFVDGNKRQAVVMSFLGENQLLFPHQINTSPNSNPLRHFEHSFHWMSSKPIQAICSVTCLGLLKETGNCSYWRVMTWHYYPPRLHPKLFSAPASYPHGTVGQINSQGSK